MNAGVGVWNVDDAAILRAAEAMYSEHLRQRGYYNSLAWSALSSVGRTRWMRIARHGIVAANSQPTTAAPPVTP